MRRNRPVLADRTCTILFFKLPSNVRMQRNVQRPDLLPEAIKFRAECVRRHVVIRAPHRAYISEPCLACTFVGQHNHSRVTLAHRRRDGVPAFPRTLKLFRIAARGHNAFEIVQRQTLSLRSIRAPLPFSVVALQRSIDLRKLRTFRRVAWRGNVHGKFY